MITKQLWGCVTSIYNATFTPSKLTILVFQHRILRSNEKGKAKLVFDLFHLRVVTTIMPFTTFYMNTLLITNAATAKQNQLSTVDPFPIKCFATRFSSLFYTRVCYVFFLPLFIKSSLASIQWVVAID